MAVIDRWSSLRGHLCYPIHCCTTLKWHLKIVDAIRGWLLAQISMYSQTCVKPITVTGLPTLRATCLQDGESKLDLKLRQMLYKDIDTDHYN